MADSRLDWRLDPRGFRGGLAAFAGSFALVMAACSGGGAEPDAGHTQGGLGGHTSGGAASVGGALGSSGTLSAGGSGTAGDRELGGSSGAAGASGSSAGMGGTLSSGGSAGQANSGSGGVTSGGAPSSAGAATAGTSGSAGAAGTSCTTPPSAGPLVGWAAVAGMNQSGTTGGGTASPVTVSTTAAFNSAAAGSTPKVLYVKGTMAGTFKIGSNTTVVGLCGAKLQGHVSLSNSVNVIVRNLTIQGNNCTDSPNDCGGGSDAVTVGDNSHHVWFDHCDVYDGSDGNLDITSGADFVTVSWSRFHYTTARSDPTAGASGHRFSNLIGSADDVPGDVGHLNVTFHHNWWGDHVDQRMPRTRHGKIHVFNNLFTAAGNNYCTNSGYQATLLVENNVYRGVRNPLQPDVGNMLARGNVFEGTSGTSSATGTGFTPTYPYTLDQVEDLAAAIMTGSGPH